MDEVARFLIVGGVLLVVAAAVAVTRRRRSIVRMLPVSLGPFPVVVVFGSETCAACLPVIDALRSGGISYVSYRWETDRAVFDELHIDEVPRVIAADAEGRVRVDVRGDVTPRHVARLRPFA